MIRIVVVDDHPWFREGLVFEFGRAAGLQVVGEAANGQEALTCAAASCPDVVVLDLALPVMDGATALPGLVAAGARVLVLTLSEEDATVFACLRAGASGYLVKGVGSDSLVSAIFAVHAGHAVLGPGVARASSIPAIPSCRSSRPASARSWNT